VTRDSDRWTLPNGISAARLVGAVGFLALYLSGQHLLGALLLGLLGASDFLDGFVARRLGMVSDLGKILDPVADRVLIVSAVLAAFITSALPRWILLALLAREAIITVGTLALVVSRRPRIAVVWVGKAGTFLVMVALPLALLAHGGPTGTQFLEPIATAGAVVGLLALCLAAGLYVRRVLPVAEAKAVRGTGKVT
jgi:cardiolipin synthase